MKVVWLGLHGAADGADYAGGPACFENQMDCRWLELFGLPGVQRNRLVGARQMFALGSILTSATSLRWSAPMNFAG